MEVFRFAQGKFLDSFFATGKIRLSPLANYRDVVALGNEVGDPYEGVGRSGERRRLLPEGALPSVFGPVGAPGGVITISNCTFSVSNGYMFSTATSTDPAMAARWAKEGRDACMRVPSVEAFASRIRRALEREVGPVFEELVTVRYGDPEVQSLERLERPHYWKDLPYAWQREHRCIFFPARNHSPLEPIFLEIPAARAYCTRM